MTKYRGIRVHHKMTLSERLAFYSKYEPETGCRMWQGANKGPKAPYGVMSFKGVKKSAHIWAYEDKKGPVPFGKEVCHTCDRHGCIAEEHLFAGTHRENMADMIAKNRGNKCKGIAHGRAKLTEEQVRLIRSDPRGKRSIAAAFGVSATLIMLIRQRKAWKHI